MVETLWNSGYLEERILSAKILGRICKKDPDRSMELLRKFVNSITNWAECDTLATQGVRKIAKSRQNELLQLSRELINSPNPWKRRFALVLLLNFKKDAELMNAIKEIIEQAEGDKEYYVKKAVEWLKRSMFRD